MDPYKKLKLINKAVDDISGIRNKTPLDDKRLKLLLKEKEGILDLVKKKGNKSSNIASKKTKTNRSKLLT